MPLMQHTAGTNQNRQFRAHAAALWRSVPSLRGVPAAFDDHPEQQIGASQLARVKSTSKRVVSSFGPLEKQYQT